jgi:hypothetical protein
MSEQDSTEDNQDPSAVKNPRFPEITGEGEEGKTWAEYQASKNQRINLESPDVDAEASEASGIEDVKKAFTDGEEVAKARPVGETLQEIGDRAIENFDGFGPDTETVEKAAPGGELPLTREEMKAAHRRTNSPVKEAVRETKEEISKLREGLEGEREERVAALEKAAEEDGPDAVERLERGTEDALAKIEALEERLAGEGGEATEESRKTVSKSSGPDMTTEDWETLAEALDDSLRDQMPV